MSTFVFLFRSNDADRTEAMGTPERAKQSMNAWLAWIRELEAKGHLKDPGQPLDTSGKVVSGKQQVVTDGPFTEAKDMVLGFIMVEARDMEEAVALSRGCPMLAGSGSVEIRPVRTFAL